MEVSMGRLQRRQIAGLGNVASGGDLTVARLPYGFWISTVEEMLEWKKKEKDWCENLKDLSSLGLTKISILEKVTEELHLKQSKACETREQI
ncbi:hypothetical protein MA16_Dca012684 [Dendrobium catenatum]|uniref:Uncharacterized protein n=1 Tax=Dendrobium catenatum TaxID=906689 RepID=A0A2I0WPL4_9ASPA|nr:hypothetical protein MA16_Dca012684 [Dendrobium catenatum]